MRFHCSLDHIGVFLTEFLRKAIISQYCYNSLAAVNQDNHLNIIPGNLWPLSNFAASVFFIQSDVLQIKNWKIILFSGHNANSVLYGQEYVCDCLGLQICATSDLDIPYFTLHYL